MAESELITLILYPVPAGVAPGIIAAMVPLALEFNVPILMGAAKDPAASESCAVKIFPALRVPVLIVNGTVIAPPGQTGV